MSLSNYENARDRGQPIEAFEFIYGEGTGDVFRYTDAEQDIMLDGNLFTAVPIMRTDAAKTKGRPKGTDLKIEIPASLGLAQLFRGTPPRRVIFVRIYQSHIPNDTDPATWSSTLALGLFWSGRVLESGRRKGGIVRLTCDTLGAGMKRPGLVKFYQRSCQARLYGPYCKADKLAATETSTASSVDGDAVGLPIGWEGSRAISDFIGGLIEWEGPYGTETRMIVQPFTESVTLDGPATGLAVSDTVKLILGCPHTLDACTNLHNNINNYQGFPWIPRKNPINKNNHT